MPWDEEDAPSFTKKASSPKKKRQWAAVSNSMLAAGKSEKSAIKGANAVVGGFAEPAKPKKKKTAAGPKPPAAPKAPAAPKRQSRRRTY